MFVAPCLNFSEGADRSTSIALLISSSISVFRLPEECLPDPSYRVMLSSRFLKLLLLDVAHAITLEQHSHSHRVPNFYCIA